jgi:hypothetical protein
MFDPVDRSYQPVVVTGTVAGTPLGARRAGSDILAFLATLATMDDLAPPWQASVA